MTFEAAEQFILSLNNLPRREYQNDAKHCDLYLKRLQFFLNLIGNPERQIPHYIHITGTSGKGSVTTYLQSILTASGQKTGATVSPHPTIITERWLVDNRHMNKKEFVEIVESLKPKLDEYVRTSPYDMLSFFEVTEAVGLIFLAQQKVDWAVMEVGCGGRYDSSNVIPNKEVAVITNIGLDHVGLIGNNKAEICYEKAGIIKPGCKVFTMEQDAKLLAIIKKEAEKNKVKVNEMLSIKYQVLRDDLKGTEFVYHDQKYQLSTIGNHQIDNAILCIEIAKSLGIAETAIKKGLAQAKQPLRMEIVSQNPLIILDGAHNADKMKTTVDTIKSLTRPISSPYQGEVVRPLADRRGSIHLIIGFSGNKMINNLIKQLITLKPKSVACTRFTMNVFRQVADPKLLAKKIKKLLPNCQIEIFLDPTDALAWLQQQANKNDIILSTGSIFLSGEIRGKMK